MCKSITAGGQRCAAHTRPTYEAALPGTAEWDRAAADYAATPTGAVTLTIDLVNARHAAKQHPSAENVAVEMALSQALARGRQIREANEASAGAIAEAAQREAAPFDTATVFVMPAEDFAQRFEPGEYQRSGGGWDEVLDHPAFMEANPFNPERVHADTWDAFTADIAAHGIREPVEIDSYSSELAEGHHRVVAALTTGVPVRFTVTAVHDKGALGRELLAEGITVETPAPTVTSTATTPAASDGGTAEVELDWDPGTPNTTAGEHWSIAQGGDRWHAGGCGAFAIALTERWPHLKIAAEMYNDHGAESVAHAWAYDPTTNTRFHIFGAEAWEPTQRPDYDPESHRVLLDQTAEDVRRLFRGFNTSEDAVYDAMDVACEQFDPAYAPDPDGGDRNYLYFW